MVMLERKARLANITLVRTVITSVVVNHPPHLVGDNFSRGRSCK
jgi:hypothetical protein